MALVKCPQCQHTVSEVASVCPGCGADLVSGPTAARRRDSGQTMLCHRCSAVLPVNAPVCCNCGVLEPRPKRSVFQPSMVGLATALVVLALVLGTRIGRGGEPVTAAEPALAARSQEAGVPAPVRAPGSATRAQLEPAPVTVRRWTRTWVNVREGRGTSNAIVTTLDPGVAVDVHDQQGSWWAVVEAGRHLGYVANSVLQREPPPVVRTDVEPPLMSRSNR